VHRKKAVADTKLPPVSVIICARNEEDNLVQNLELVLHQNYPKFEVIIVDHQSVDGTKEVLFALQKENPHLKVIHIARNAHLKIGKKLPLSVGIKGAKHEHLLLTDADCKPASSDWLRLMVSNFTDKKQIVLGYGPYERQKGFLNFIIRFDTIQIAINYFSFALNGLSYMGVGRNIAYTQTVYKQANGFKNHYGIASGDDDLFIKEAANFKNVAIEYTANAHCTSTPPNTWRKWVQQKHRHFSTAPSYKVITKLLLGIFPLALLSQLFSFVILSLDRYYFFWVFIIFSSIFVIRWIIQLINFNKLKALKLAIFYPFIEWLHLLIMALMYYSRGNEQNKWK
jgi:cellulose synthase/poly-beta-1,6-N-acetylglucosamine synthase-like glycosyltransferase